MISVLGIIGAIISSLIVVLGLTQQIYLNFKRKSCEGLAPILFFLVSVSYITWSLYSLLKPDYFLAIPQTLGAVISLILLFQWFRYRKNKPSN